MRFRGILPAFVAGLVFANISEADASGFAVRETSATGQGNAFAGATASAEDISFMVNNPAGLTRHPGRNFAEALGPDEKITLLNKPFELPEFARVLRRALDSDGA